MTTTRVGRARVRCDKRRLIPVSSSCGRRDVTAQMMANGYMPMDLDISLSDLALIEGIINAILFLECVPRMGYAFSSPTVKQFEFNCSASRSIPYRPTGVGVWPQGQGWVVARGNGRALSGGARVRWLDGGAPGGTHREVLRWTGPVAQGHCGPGIH